MSRVHATGRRRSAEMLSGDAHGPRMSSTSPPDCLPLVVAHRRLEIDIMLGNWASARLKDMGEVRLCSLGRCIRQFWGAEGNGSGVAVRLRFVSWRATYPLRRRQAARAGKVDGVGREGATGVKDVDRPSARTCARKPRARDRCRPSCGSGKGGALPRRPVSLLPPVLFSQLESKQFDEIIERPYEWLHSPLPFV
jgi:hypothetical protein